MPRPPTARSKASYIRFLPHRRATRPPGRAFWERRHLRKHEVDPPTSPQTMAAQIAAFTEWRHVRGERFAELKTITQPTLVVNGSQDVMIPTINSFTLSQHIPNAPLIDSIRTPATQRTFSTPTCSWCMHARFWTGDRHRDQTRQHPKENLGETPWQIPSAAKRGRTHHAVRMAETILHAPARGAMSTHGRHAHVRYGVAGGRGVTPGFCHGRSRCRDGGRRGSEWCYRGCTTGRSAGREPYGQGLVAVALGS